MRLAARIQGVGLIGPGLAGWDAARAILAGSQPYASAPTVIPVPEALPATERRRAGKCVRLALGAGLAAAADAKRDARDLAAVLSSSTGDGDNLHAICEALASDDRLISPTRFHNSVHNAPAGYWGIATGATHPSDCLAGYDASFAAGLLEALGRLAADPACAVVLVAYDAPYPEPLATVRPIVDAFAVGLVLARADEGDGIRIEARTSRSPVTPMEDAALEILRTGVPAARALPLLERVARRQTGEVAIEYLDDLSLAVGVSP